MEDKSLFSGTIWKFCERLGVFGAQFIVHIILARILLPSDYGALAIMTVFIAISNVFIQNGFNTALIQMEDVKERDYSSVLWVSLLIAGVLYAVIYIISPFVGQVYELPNIIWPLRIIAIVLFPGALYSVLLAKVSRNLDFKKVFYSNFAGAMVSGVIGIIIAKRGGGLWALVIQYIINTSVSCILLLFGARLKYSFKIDWSRIKKFLSYGWKLIVSGVLNTLNEQLNSLLIGLKYNTESLGFYTRGMQFPNYGISIIQDTITGVMLPSVSRVQDDKIKAKELMKNFLLLSTFFVIPMMCGLAVIAPELVEILLTSKWGGCIPYMCLFCGVFAFYPAHVCNLQTLNALGRSDLFLKVEIIKKCYSIVLIVLMILLFNSPLAVAICTLVISPVGWFVNAYPNKKLINYGFIDQLRDLIPNILCALVMLLVIFPISFIKMNNYISIITKLLAGIVSYIVICKITKNQQYNSIKSMIYKRIKKVR